MSLAKDLALEFCDAARANYERDGHVVPMVAGVGADLRTVIVGLATDSNDVPRDMAEVAAVLYAIERVAMIVTVSEAWSQTLKPEQEFSGYERGELEARAQLGDTSVHTVVMANVYNIAGRDLSYSRCLDADDGFAVLIDAEGPMEGRMADMMWHALDTVARNPPPEGMWRDRDGNPVDLDAALDIFFGLKARVQRNDPSTS